MKIAPEVIAWSKGHVIIPFENVLFVTESWDIDGGIEVHMTADGKAKAVYVPIREPHAQEFVDKYNAYLAAVEGLTIESKLVPVSEKEGEG